MKFERKDLWDIRERANKEASYDDINIDWKRAYAALAMAADHLDAMIARCTVAVPKED